MAEILHEFLCPACAHRDHDSCLKTCAWCRVHCGCVCQRWAVPVEADPQDTV